MTKIEKILLPVVIVAAAGMCVLWINEQQSNKKLTHQLQSKESELQQVDADRRGLLKANDQLLGRLSQVEKAAAELKAAPRPIAVDEEIEEIDLPPAFVEETPRSRENDQEPTILSPEELAEKQKRDEEREARMVEREKQRKEFQERVTADIQNRRAFFSQINTDGLSPEYQAAHQDLMERLDVTEVLMNKMADPELSRDERREVGRELWGQSREMGELMDMQRDVLLNDYAELSLGLSREKTQEFMDYMETVNQMTSGSPMRGGGGGGGRGR